MVKHDSLRLLMWLGIYSELPVTEGVQLGCLSPWLF